MAEPLWTLRGARLGAGARPRLDDVTLEIRPGVTAILGPSGAGKTSLLNLLVGFERAAAGEVRASLPAAPGRLPLYWVPPDAGLWSHLTVREHLARAQPPGGGADRIASLLAALDMADKADATPDLLSQGERSRLALARALAADPSVLVMDEPLVHVDPLRAARGWDAVRSWAADRGASLVFSTHDPGRVLAEASRVACLAEGRLLHEGPVEDLYWRPPSAAAADCLGESNWLPAGEARRWLGEGNGEARCLRPEQIAIERREGSALVVRGTRFRGAVEEAELEDGSSGRRRRFFHRPAGPSLKPGDRVAIRVLSLLALALLSGCGGDAPPAIPFSEAHYWPMAADGNAVRAPRSVAVGRPGEILVLDNGGRVLVFGEGGRVLRSWRMPDTARGRPEGVCLLEDGRIAVGDTHYSRVVLFDAEGRIQGTIGRFGKGPGEFIYPVDVTQDSRGDLYVCEYGSNDRVQKFSKDGRFLLQFGSFGTGPGEFQRPSGLSWKAGRVYVADAINNQVKVFADDGRFLSVLGSPAAPLALHMPYDVSVGPDGALWVAEYGAGRVSKVSLDGKLLGRFGGPGAGEGQFSTPWGIAADASGRVWVADTGNRRLVELRP